MEISQLEYFVTLAEHLHYRRAAAAAGVSPSTLSRQIAELEADIDAKLLERNRRQVRLTAAGETFLVDARATLHRLRFAAIDARRIGRGDQARLRIGHGDAAAVKLLQIALPELRAAHPGLRLQVVEAGSGDLVDGVASGRLDLALFRPPLGRPDLDDEHLCDEPLVLVVPAGHRLAARARARVTDLAGEPLVVPQRSAAPGGYDAIMSIFAAGRVEPEITEEATTSVSTLLMVGAGLGIAILPASSAGQSAVEGVAVVALAGTPTVALHLTWRPGSEAAPIADLRQGLRRAVETWRSEDEPELRTTGTERRATR